MQDPGTGCVTLCLTSHLVQPKMTYPAQLPRPDKFHTRTSSCTVHVHLTNLMYMRSSLLGTVHRGGCDAPVALNDCRQHCHPLSRGPPPARMRLHLNAHKVNS
jgi:hypothetical protein